jgi:predicted transport protein
MYSLGVLLVLSFVILFLSAVLFIFKDRLMGLPIKFELEQVGLKVDTSTFAIVLVGIVGIMCLVFYLFLQKELNSREELREQVEALTKQIENNTNDFYVRFQQYEYVFQLSIPSYNKSLATIKDSINIIAWITHNSNKSFRKIRNSEFEVTAVNTLWLNLNDLRFNDKVQFQIELNNIGSFISEPFEIPNHTIILKKMGKSR